MTNFIFIFYLNMPLLFYLKCLNIGQLFSTKLATKQGGNGIPGLQQLLLVVGLLMLLPYARWRCASSSIQLMFLGACR
jgi:hypothetical protein